jgi:Flp pilus assembly protein TadG
MIINLLYSLAGLMIGFVVGRWFQYGFQGEVVHKVARNWFHSHKGGNVRPMGEAHYDPLAPIPTVIPAIKFDPSTGEPLIATEEVHHPSPVPRGLAIVMILLAIVSVGYLFLQKQHDADALRTANDRLSAQVKANTALTLQLQHQQGVIDANEKRLEDLVLAISTAKTPGEVTEAIQRFLKSSARAHAQEQQYQQNGGTANGQPSSSHPEDTRGSPSPHPSSSSSPHPSPSPSQSTPPPVQVCITTPKGQVCEPAAIFIAAAPRPLRALL